MNKKAKGVLFTLVLMIVLGGCSEKQEDIYFFPKNAAPTYEASFTDDNIELLITEMKRFDDGILYELKIDYSEKLIDVYGIDMLNLGFYFVQNDKIYFIQDTDSLNELETVEYIIANGTIVCQEEEKADALGSGRGWHEFISADGNKRVYRGYNDLTETGYFLHMTWEKGVGLVHYERGYGALKDYIELNLIYR